MISRAVQHQSRPVYTVLPPRMTALGIYLPEWLVLMLAAVTFYLYRYFEIPLRAPLSLYLQRVKGMVPCYLIALLVVLLVTRLTHIQAGFAKNEPLPWGYTWAVFKERFLHPLELFRDLRFLNLICVMFVVFVNMKHLIPLVNPESFDGVMLALERGAFNGELFGEQLIELLGINAAPILSTCYTLFYPFVALLIYSFIIQRNEQLTVQFLTAFVLTWFIGLFVVYAFPTRGPIFMEPELFSALPQTEVTGMQEKLRYHAETLEGEPAHPNAVFLISALPSLHLAVAVLGGVYLRRIHPTLSLLAWIFAAVTVLSTVYFGWHYLLDDVAAVVLVACVAKITDRIHRPRFQRV